MREDMFFPAQENLEDKDSMEGENEKLLLPPEIIIGQEKGIHIMSLMLKAYDSRWGNNDHELARATKEYFGKNALDEEIRKSLDDLRILKEGGVDEETLLNLSLCYSHPERSEDILAYLEECKDIDNLREVQKNVLSLMEKFQEKTAANPEFLVLENKFDDEAQKDIKEREDHLADCKSEMIGVLDYFRPMKATTAIDTVKILPTNFLYREDSGKAFVADNQIEIMVSLKEFEKGGQWTHEFLHSIINPITDKLSENLTDVEMDKIIELSSAKLKKRYGENMGLLNESLIRTYVNFFQNKSGAYGYEYFKNAVDHTSEETFEKHFNEDEGFKKDCTDLGIFSLKDLSEKSKEYFDRYEKDMLGKMSYDLYEDYEKEIKAKREMNFENFVLEKFRDYLGKYSV